MEDKYLYMIRKAQEFMNENHFADVSRVQCLLRKMMSKEYHGLIDQIKECQDPHVIFNIHGGNNLIAPNASQTERYPTSYEIKTNGSRPITRRPRSPTSISGKKYVSR